MKIYRTDWKIAIVFIVALVIWIFGASTQAFNKEVFINASLGMTALITLVILLINWFSSISISGTTLKFVYLLFQRHTIDINSITEINDQSTYKVAKGAFRSLYIFYKDQQSKKKYIELRITIFPENTLGKLIKHLKQINPKIELNKYSEKLMQSAP